MCQWLHDIGPWLYISSEGTQTFEILFTRNITIVLSGIEAKTFESNIPYSCDYVIKFGDGRGCYEKIQICPLRF